MTVALRFALNSLFTIVIIDCIATWTVIIVGVVVTVIPTGQSYRWLRHLTWLLSVAKSILYANTCI